MWKGCKIYKRLLDDYTFIVRGKEGRQRAEAKEGQVSGLSCNIP